MNMNEENNRYDVDLELQKAIEERRRRNLQNQAAAQVEEDVKVVSTITNMQPVEPKEDLGNTIVKPLNEVKEMMDKTVISNPLPKPEPIKEEPVQESEEENKINKAITYGIITVIVLLLMGLVLVAGKVVLDDMFEKEPPISEQTPQTDEDQQDEIATPEIDVDQSVDAETDTETDKEENKDEEKDGEDITDHSARIAALEAQKKSYEDKIASYNEKIDEAKQASETAQDVLDKEIEGYEENIKKAQDDADTYQVEVLEVAKEDYDESVVEAEENPDNEDKQTIMNLKAAAYEVCCQEYDRLIALVGQYTLEYETIKETNEKLIEDNKKDIEKWEENISKLEDKIIEIDAELASLTAE